MPRETFLKDVGKHLNHAVFLGFLWSLAIIPTTRAEDNDEDIDEVYSSEGYTPELTPDLIAKAEFIASDLMRFIPVEIFENRPEEMIQKEKELEQRSDRIRNLPEFDIRKIPFETVRKCLEIMYGDDLWLNVDDDPEELYDFGRPMIYLAWLWANGFMISDDIEAVPAEGFYLDFEDYEHFDDPGD